MRLRFSTPTFGRRSLVLAVLVAVVLLPASVRTDDPRSAAVVVVTDFPLYAAFTPNDPCFNGCLPYGPQWGLLQVDAPQAWDVTLGSRGVVVAVVDTGVWWTHTDIQANMWTNQNGSLSGTHGYDFISQDANPMDEDVPGGTFHGTGVAGVIAALTDNGEDIAGGAQVSVIALRALGPDGQGSSFNTSQAIRWAVDHGARIINLSLGTNETFVGPTDISLAIDYAVRRGALVIAAAGNGINGVGQPVLDYPARLPNVVSVGALDASGDRAAYSNYGAGLDIMAPGTGILTLTSNNGVHQLSGTSLATPFVTAEAALLLSQDPALTNVELWNILNETAVPRGTGYNTGYGWGLANFWNAINALNRPFISVNSFPQEVTRSSGFSIAWSVLGPAGLTVDDTHVEWGTDPARLGNRTVALTGTTRQSYTATGLVMPEGVSTFYFKIAAVVNGTRYESQVRSIEATNLPEFLFVLYNLLASNLLYLALFILALAAVVAFLPQRRARRRRIAYQRRVYAPAYRPPGPSPEPPPQAPGTRVETRAAPPTMATTPAAVPRPMPPADVPPLEFVRPTPPPPAATYAPPPPPAAPAKKRCPSCGTMVNADNLFCFFCGNAFR